MAVNVVHFISVISAADRNLRQRAGSGKRDRLKISLSAAERVEFTHNGTITRARTLRITHSSRGTKYSNARSRGQPVHLSVTDPLLRAAETCPRLAGNNREEGVERRKRER